jgi:hypothetical protein
MPGGILHGLDPNAPPRPPRRRDPDAEKAVEKAIHLAIEESARCREIEQLRVEVASHFLGILDDDLRWAADRCLGKNFSANTLRQYKGQFQRFRDWCAEFKYPSLPTVPEVLASYLLQQAADGTKPTALERILAAVKWAHLVYDQGGGPGLVHHSCNFDDPIILAVLRLARRTCDEERKGKTAKKSGANK